MINKERIQEGPKEEVIDIDLGDPEVDKAASIILDIQKGKEKLVLILRIQR